MTDKKKSRATFGTEPVVVQATEPKLTVEEQSRLLWTLRQELSGVDAGSTAYYPQFIEQMNILIARFKGGSLGTSEALKPRQHKPRTIFGRFKEHAALA